MSPDEAHVPEVPAHDDRPRCLARPLSARRGFRADLLCASIAGATVDFRGSAVPVCGIHVKTYANWGSRADDLARMLWGWPLAEGGDAQLG